MLEHQDELFEALQAGSTDKIKDILEDMHAVDVAMCLEDVDDDILENFYHLSDTEFLSEVLEQAEEELQVRILSKLDYPSIINLFSYMSKDDIADILGNLPIGMRKSLLNLMKVSDSRELQVLMGYEEDTAGGIMTTEYIALYGDLNMEKVLFKIKEIGPKTEVIEKIFVLNRQRQLVGIADLRDILVAPLEDDLYSIMDDNVICVYPEEDQEEVSKLVGKYDLSVLPVINRKNSLLGVITVDDVIDVIVEEQTEDILRLGGVSGEEKIGGPLFASVGKRLPWLLVNLGTALLASFTISAFENIIVQVAALAASMTIISGMGGNAGTQTLSLTIRGITLGELSLKENWNLIFKEIFIAFIDGIAVGLVIGLIQYFRYGNFYLGVIIFIAMICNLIIAGICGMLIPLALNALHVDPALSSTIFLTTATDVFGFFVFLGLAKLFLPLLI